MLDSLQVSSDYRECYSCSGQSKGWLKNGWELLLGSFWWLLTMAFASQKLAFVCSLKFCKRRKEGLVNVPNMVTPTGWLTVMCMLRAHHHKDKCPLT